jgi:LPPG:FO 2-phospho-L-lactate transferase
MSDDPVRSMVHTKDGRVLEFQEYFVKERHEPEIDHVELVGLDDAKPAPGVLDAIHASDVVVLCPSNPFVSIAPIVGLPGVRPALAEHPRVVAVTPIVGGEALKGPADRMLAATGIEVSPSGVASLYRDFCNEFVVDVTDLRDAEAIAAMDIRPLIADTVMTDDRVSNALARAILEPT